MRWKSLSTPSTPPELLFNSEWGSTRAVSWDHLPNASHKLAALEQMDDIITGKSFCFHYHLH